MFLVCVCDGFSLSRVVLRSLHGNDISELPDGIFNDAASLSHLWVNVQPCFTRHCFTHTEQKRVCYICSSDTLQLCVFPEFLQRLVSLSSDPLNMFAVTARPREVECDPTCPSAHTLPVMKQLLHLIGWGWWKVVDTHTHTHLWHTSHEYFRWFLIVNGLVS